MLDAAVGASLILFLASGERSFVNGTELVNVKLRRRETAAPAVS